MNFIPCNSSESAKCDRSRGEVKIDPWGGSSPRAGSAAPQHVVEESARIPCVRSFATSAASYRENTQDRALVFDVGDASIVCVADGTGGVSGGAQAAELFIAGVRQAGEQHTFDLTCADNWTALFTALDHEIERDVHAGETTGIAIAITPTALVGASAGDSQAWLAGRDGWHELTERQIRKARLGTGRAQAQSFSARPSGTLLLATDGLFDYVKFDDIANVLRAAPHDAAEALVQLLRAHFQKLADDVAVVVANLG
jgi:serine/threonine protein phosphatase PrpC